jgi:hypothetical protein
MQISQEPVFRPTLSQSFDSEAFYIEYLCERLGTPHRRDSGWQLCAPWKHSRAKPRCTRCGESLVEAPFYGGRQRGF